MKGVNRIICVVAAALACSSASQAAFQVRINSGSTTRTLTPGVGTTPAVVTTGNNQTFTLTNYSIPGFTIGSIVATRNNVTGTLTLQLFNIVNTGLANATLALRLANTEFTAPDGIRTLSYSHSYQGDPVTASFRSQFNNGTGYGGGPFYPDNSGPSRVSTSGDANFSASGFDIPLPSGSGGYTLTSRFQVTLAGGASLESATVVTDVNATPAPAGLLLGLLGVPAFALVRRFTRKSGNDAEVEPTVAA